MRNTTDLNAVFAKNLKTIRENNKLSQEELGNIAGLHRTFISQIERGERNSTLETLQKVSDALGVDPKDLISDV